MPCANSFPGLLASTFHTTISINSIPRNPPAQMHGPDRLRRRALFMLTGLDQGQCERRRFCLPQGLGRNGRGLVIRAQLESAPGRTRSGPHLSRRLSLPPFCRRCGQAGQRISHRYWRHQQRETQTIISVSRHGADSRGPNPARKSAGQGLPAESPRHRRQWPALVRHVVHNSGRAGRQDGGDLDYRGGTGHRITGHDLHHAELVERSHRQRRRRFDSQEAPDLDRALYGLQYRAWSRLCLVVERKRPEVGNASAARRSILSGRGLHRRRFLAVDAGIADNDTFPVQHDQRWRHRPELGAATPRHIQSSLHRRRISPASL